MTDFSGLVEIGESAVHGAADLLSEILAAVQLTSGASTSANAASLLNKLRTLSSKHDPGDQAGELLDSSKARLTALFAFERRLDVLTETLQADIVQLKQLLKAIPDDDPDSVACRSLAERRLHHLAAGQASLARCRILLRQLVRTEHLCSDTLGQMRDVTVPMAAREAALAGLVRATEAARTLGRESDIFCRELLEQDIRHLVRTGRK